MIYDGSIRIDTRIDSRGFNAGVRALTAALTPLAAAIGAAFSITAAVQFGKTAVRTASELASALTGLHSVLTSTGRSFAEARAFIDEYTRDGLIPATNAINAYKNLALRGYDTSQIQTTLIALKDAAAFGRQSSLTMGEAVQSATEGLKNENSILVDNAGVTKNVAAMWRDFAASIGTTVDKLTKQQKIQAEVKGILEESKHQAGDAAKAASGYAGQVAALGTSFYNLRVAIGNTLIPMLSRVIDAIKPVVDWLVILFNKLAQVMSLLFNVDISASATGMDAVAAGTQAAADAQEELAENTAKAGKAAKGALAAFDELNVLQQDTGRGDGAGAPGVPAVGEAGAGISTGEGPLPPEPEIVAIVNRIKAAFAELTGPLQEPFERLKESVSELGGTIWDGLEWAYNNILVPVGEWASQELSPVALDLLSAALDLLNSVLEALEPLGRWLWEEFLQPIGEWAGEALLDALEWLTERLEDLSDWIDNNQTTIETFVIIVGSFAAAWWAVNAAVTVWNVIGAVATTVTTGFGVAMAFLTSPIFLVALAIGAIIAIIILLIKNWDEVKEVAGKVWDWIVEKWSQASEWFQTNVTEPVAEWFSAAWENIREWAANAWEKIKDIWAKAKEWFQEKVIDPVKDGFQTALDWIEDKWKLVFNSVKDFVRNRINNIIDFINSMLQAVANGINGVIGALNKIQINLPAVPPFFEGLSLGVNIPLVSVPQIPRLATGAVIPPNSEFLAVLGDQRSGRNIETPEGLLRQIMREELSQYQADREITINFAGSLGALVQELKPYIDRENRRVGKSLIRGVA